LLVHGGLTRSGKRLVSEEVLRRYTTVSVSAVDKSNGFFMRAGRGFLLGSMWPSLYGWWGTQRCFGHAGAFCAVAWADPDLDLAVAIVTNGNSGPMESFLQFAPLGSALRRACSRSVTRS
jgi:CubicO group peptidase (beta-lactamase class C family)